MMRPKRSLWQRNLICIYGRWARNIGKEEKRPGALGYTQFEKAQIPLKCCLYFHILIFMFLMHPIRCFSFGKALHIHSRRRMSLCKD